MVSVPSLPDQDPSAARPIRTCALVQGNIRVGTDEVLACLARHFDVVILSTWEDEPVDTLPKGIWDILLNPKPLAAGYSHRNFQRLSTAAGLRRARTLGVSHVLKWRTDMLPAKLDVAHLLAWANENVPAGLSTRLVTCAFRNLSVQQDWFSTIPDVFGFAGIDLMELLWGDDGFDYTLNMNPPDDMVHEAGMDWMSRPDAAGLFCPEAELYANFRSRLQRRLGVKLTHVDIAKRHMRLIDHGRLGICWFGAPGQFRSITQALQHPWWTERIWQHGDPTLTEWGYPESGLRRKFRRKYLTPRAIRRELDNQIRWYKTWSD